MDQEQMLSLRAVTNPLHPSVEIIAIASPSDHADQPNKAWKSWTAPNGRNWLRDYLPSERPNARVLFFSSTVRGHDLEHSESIIDTIAKRLLSRVIRAREKDGVPEDVPIIFIAHSLGAFVLKAALLFASQARHQGFQTIYNQTSRIVFLAAPHVWRHAEQNLGKLASAIAKVSSVPSSDAFLDALEDSGEVLQDINEDFIEMNKDAPLEIINFAETLPTPNWGYGRGVILGLPSSSLPVDFEDEEDELFEDATPLKKSHLSICTFSSRSDEDYGKVFATMKKRQHRRRHRNHPYPQRRPTNLSESAPDLHTPPSSSRPPRHGKEGHEPDPDPPSLKDRVKDTARGLADILEPLSVIAPIVIGGGRKMYKWNRARSASKVSTTSTSSRPQRTRSHRSPSRHSPSHHSPSHDIHHSTSPRGRPRDHSPSHLRPQRRTTERPHSWHEAGGHAPYPSHALPPPRRHPSTHRSPSHAHGETHHATSPYRAASRHRSPLPGSVPMGRVHSDSGPRRGY